MTMPNCESTQQQQNARQAFYMEHEDEISNLVRRLRVLGGAMGGIASSSDPNRMRKDAAAAQTLTEDLVDELSELTGCEE
jgi:hypothetical protein